MSTVCFLDEHVYKLIRTDLPPKVFDENLSEKVCPKKICPKKFVRKSLRKFVRKSFRRKFVRKSVSEKICPKKFEKMGHLVRDELLDPVLRQASLVAPRVLDSHPAEIVMIRVTRSGENLLWAVFGKL
jgi:hypothetical protein